MARRSNSKVYSVYHAMDERGVFESNVANAGAVNVDGISIYEGPVQYPKMLYHPMGEVEIVSQGVMVVNREGDPVKDDKGNVKYAGRQWGMKNVTVSGPEEEAEWIGKGWHTSEAAALRGNPVTAASAPPKSKNEQYEDRIKELEAKLAAQGFAAPTKPSLAKA